MPFDVTTADIKKTFIPLGFDVEIEGQYEDEDRLRITHPDHEGIVIDAIVINGLKAFDDLNRKVEGGIEASLGIGISTQEEFDALTQTQDDHLYNIQYGELLDHESLNSMADFVSLVQQKIVPIPTL